MADDTERAQRQAAASQANAPEIAASEIAAKEITASNTVISTAPVARFALHEERPHVTYHTEKVGDVAFRREVRTTTVHVPVELKTEVLIIEFAQPLQRAEFQAGRQVVINGIAMELGTRMEVTLQEEKVRIDKQVYAVEEVMISKQTRQESVQVPIELQREVLVDSREPE